MKALFVLSFLTGFLLVACSREGSSSRDTQPASNAPAAFENPLNAPADYGKALVNAQATAEKTVDLAALKKAIELFQVDKGRLPKDLNELVAGKFIRQLPPAPPGMKIVYEPATGEVKVGQP